MLIWHKHPKEPDTWTAMRGRIWITETLDERGRRRWRLFDIREYAGYLPGALPTWIGEEWHLSLESAQREAEKLAGWLMADPSAEYESLLGDFSR